MKAIEMAEVVDIKNNKEYYLGYQPAGLIFEDGDMYQYDNTYEGYLDKNKQYKFIDADGIEEICTLDELFDGIDADEYEKPE